MNRNTSILALALLSTVALPAAAGAQATIAAPLAITAAKVSIDGTSNVHNFTASTTAVRLVAAEIAGTPGEDFFAHLLTPGNLARLEVTMPAATLTSEKGDIDENMHKALKVRQFADIRFRLGAIETAAGAYRATGWLTIAGVEKEVVLALQVRPAAGTLAVTGTTDLLMTDYGIAPPRAMLGVLKTNPKVTIRLELTLAEAR
jgi:polyisoprenoid-binding protein YceI